MAVKWRTLAPSEGGSPYSALANSFHMGMRAQDCQILLLFLLKKQKIWIFMWNFLVFKCWKPIPKKKKRESFFFKHRVGQTKPIWGPDSACGPPACSPWHVAGNERSQNRQWRQAGAGGRPDLVRILALPFICCVALGKPHKPSGSCFPHLYIGIIILCQCF